MANSLQHQQQQQPRQAPMMNSLVTSEGHSTYPASPSSNSNSYYGSFYQSSQVNSSNSGMTSNAYYGNGMSGAGAGHPAQSGTHFMSSSSSQPLNNGHHPSHQLHNGGSSYTGNVHHLNNGALYHRSSDMNDNITSQIDEKPTHLYHHHHHPASSQHSMSPTLEGSDYGMKSKRRQVKNACINCQKACKRCDEGRPCTRCVKYGLGDTCQDSSRKERKRGIKRGPYKRRATTGNAQTAAITAAPSSSSHYPQSNIVVMDGSFVDHPPHASMSPHLRIQREDQSGGSVNHSGVGGEMSHPFDADHQLIHSPQYPSSAPGTIQRASAPLVDNHDTAAAPNGFYSSNNTSRDHFQSMQPPRFSRYDYDRNGIVIPTANNELQNGISRPGILPLPVSAPPGTMNFLSSSASSHSSRSLFSPPGSLSANFLNANGHHRLHSDSSLNTLGSGTTANSLSPRTPLSLSNGIGELGLSGAQSLSANSSSSSPGGMKLNVGGYIHHPGPTTTANLPTAATGAFLNPPTATTNSNQPFPLHIPNAARWRGSNGIGGNERDLSGRFHVLGSEVKDEQLAPLKLNCSSDSDVSNTTISGRYQLHSSRAGDMARNDRNSMGKVDHGGHDIMIS
ncbi:hypothetical protein CBS101457_000467 [Exobasidium rhododendri]|nr:hypothetical protein CBS101457_000467 [Exobasidium rhododendri]